jgi:hypothetical protein
MYTGSTIMCLTGQGCDNHSCVAAWVSQGRGDEQTGVEDVKPLFVIGG